MIFGVNDSLNTTGSAVIKTRCVGGDAGEADFGRPRFVRSRPEARSVAGLSASVGDGGASRRSVFTLRVRVAYMGAKFGSATTTSWPSPSRHRATHSLSVEASRRMRAGAR